MPVDQSTLFKQDRKRTASGKLTSFEIWGKYWGPRTLSLLIKMLDSECNEEKQKSGEDPRN
jgi:hypothetical protein